MSRFDAEGAEGTLDIIGFGKVSDSESLPDRGDLAAL